MTILARDSLAVHAYSIGGEQRILLSLFQSAHTKTVANGHTKHIEALWCGHIHLQKGILAFCRYIQYQYLSVESVPIPQYGIGTNTSVWNRYQYLSMESVPIPQYGIGGHT